MCVTFLTLFFKDFLKQTSFSSMLVENNHNLVVAKTFHIHLSLKKSLESNVSICCVTCIYAFYFIVSFFLSKKIKQSF